MCNGIVVVFIHMYVCIYIYIYVYIRIERHVNIKHMSTKASRVSDINNI